MNARIESQKKIKEKLGITITSAMSIGEIALAWSGASDAIKSAYPEITAAVLTAQGLMTAQEAAHTYSATTEAAYTTVKGLIEDACAILTGNPNVVVKANNLAAEQAESLTTQAVDQGTSVLLSTITDIVS